MRHDLAPTVPTPISHAPAEATAWGTTLVTARYAAGLASVADVSSAAECTRDWRELDAFMRSEGLSLLFARALSEAGTLTATAGAASFMATSVTLATRALDQFRQLADLCEALAQVGIVALPYKGPLLSWRLHGDVALRMSTDLDVVVARDEYERARAVLVARGRVPRGGHSLVQERTLFHWLGHASFGEGDVTFVELHWRFAPRAFPFALTPGDALLRSRPVQVGSRTFQLMDDRDLLVTLAMHGTRHLFERLEWLSGFARLVASTSFTTSELLAHASLLRARRMLLIAIATAEEALGLPLAEPWVEALRRDPQARRIAAQLAADIVARGRGSPVERDGAALQRLYAGMLDGPLDAVRLLLSGALLPTEREWEAVRLPDALTPLYLVVRPVRLLARWAARLVARSARSRGARVVVT